MYVTANIVDGKPLNYADIKKKKKKKMMSKKHDIVDHPIIIYTMYTQTGQTLKTPLATKCNYFC